MGSGEWLRMSRAPEPARSGPFLVYGRPCNAFPCRTNVAKLVSFDALSQRQDTAVTVLTQLSKAAGVAISASFPAYAEDGSQPRKSRVSGERERERKSSAWCARCVFVLLCRAWFSRRGSTEATCCRTSSPPLSPAFVFLLNV